MVVEMFCIHYILVSNPGLTFVISIVFFYLSVSLKVLISRCHLLFLAAYFKRYVRTASNQQLIHSCLICYIAISNI